MQKQGENEVYKTKKDILTTIHAIQNKQRKIRPHFFGSFKQFIKTSLIPVVKPC